MKQIELTQGQFALVDDEDFEYLNQWNWHAQKTESGYYAVRRGPKIKKDGNQIVILMHRVILGLIDPKIFADHKDRNPLNNQRNNLRISTYSQNGCNRRSKKGSASKYLGVSILNVKDRGKVYTYWRAIIKTKEANKWLGSFKTEQDAALAYNNSAKILHGEFANLNII